MVLRRDFAGGKRTPKGRQHRAPDLTARPRRSHYTFFLMFIGLCSGDSEALSATLGYRRLFIGKIGYGLQTIIFDLYLYRFHFGHLFISLYRQLCKPLYLAV